MKIKKKALPIILSLCLLAGLFPMTAYADSIPVQGVTITGVSNHEMSLPITQSDSDKGHVGLTISPTDATNKQVTWNSSDSSIATVYGNSEGATITAYKTGRTRITVSANDTTNGSLSDYFILTVTEPSTIIVKGISIKTVDSNGNNMNVSQYTVGHTYQLRADINPSNASNKQVVWSSSDNNVATVVAGGVLRCKEIGNARITATAKDGSGVSGNLSITVKDPIYVSSLTITNKQSLSSYEMSKNITAKVYTSVSPSNRTEGGDVSFTSSNPSVATIDSNGNIKTVSAGSTTITASIQDALGTYSDSVTIKVKDDTSTNPSKPDEKKPVTGFAIKNNSSKAREIEVTQRTEDAPEIEVQFTPSDAYNKQVQWSSSDSSVVSVARDNNNKYHLIGHKAGRARITGQAYDTSQGTFSDYVIVTVTEPKTILVQSVRIQPVDSEGNNINIPQYTINKEYQLSAVITPSDAKDKSVKWTTSDSSIVSVSDTGKIKCKEIGTARITVTTNDGGKTSYLDISVKDPATTKKITIQNSKEFNPINKGDKKQIKVSVEPSNAGEDLVYESSDTKVITVSDTGLITAVDFGSARVTVKNSIGTCEAYVDVIVQRNTENMTTAYVYRLYNANSGEHLWTASELEKTQLSSATAAWDFEGIAWEATITDESTPIYRVYNSHAGDHLGIKQGDHHYTTNKAEVDYLVSVGWTYDGIAFYTMKATDDGAIPIYRLYNPNAIAGSHHYTKDKAERDYLVSIGWKDEGIGYYCYNSEADFRVSRNDIYWNPSNPAEGFYTLKLGQVDKATGKPSIRIVNGDKGVNKVVGSFSNHIAGLQVADLTFTINGYDKEGGTLIESVKKNMFCAHSQTIPVATTFNKSGINYVEIVVEIYDGEGVAEVHTIEGGYTTDKKNGALTVTLRNNDGTVSECTQACAIFYDSTGNIVDYAVGEIAPLNSLATKNYYLKTSNGMAYDNFEMYYYGYTKLH